MEGTYYHIMW